jgi:hypothetical protein
LVSIYVSIKKNKEIPDAVYLSTGELPGERASQAIAKVIDIEFNGEGHLRWLKLKADAYEATLIF